jgi:uncharacterized membrane protein
LPIKKQPSSKGASPAGQQLSGQHRLGLERLVFFSDAVFAIAVTLLVLDIRLPAGVEVGQLSNEQLRLSLVGIWHKYLAYIISFLVIGIFWISHHRKFRLIQRYDGRLLQLNLLLLMLIAFVPFPSSIISESGNRTATIFYALTMALAGSLLALLWWHAARSKALLAPEVTAEKRRREAVAPVATTLIFLVSIGLAFIDADLAKFSWLLIIPVSLMAGRG